MKMKYVGAIVFTLVICFMILWNTIHRRELENEVSEMKTQILELKSATEIHNRTYIDDAVQLSALNGYALPVVPPKTIGAMW